MCDTLVATTDVTQDGVTVFAENSDREPNEAKFILTGGPGIDMIVKPACPNLHDGKSGPRIRPTP
jgi:hypothetical protein